MKKFICLLIIFVFTGCAAQSLTLSGGVSYTVNEARQIAFDGVPKKIDMSKYKEYFVDKNYEKNQEYMKNGKFRLRNRQLTLFSDQSYGIRYKKNKTTGFYYDKYGKLENIEVRSSLKYPTKTYLYSTKGTLENVVFVVSIDEAFIYKMDGKLDSHWIGDDCFDENGNFVLKRL